MLVLAKASSSQVAARPETEAVRLERLPARQKTIALAVARVLQEVSYRVALPEETGALPLAQTRHDQTAAVLLRARAASAHRA